MDNKWNIQGIPHKGWNCVGIEDLGEDLDDLDADDKQEYYEICEMCGQEGIRYVHIMTHPEYDRKLSVGYKCAEKMEDDYVNPKLREKEFKNKLNRRKNFLKQLWEHRKNGNFVLNYKGIYITIMKSRYKNNEYGVMFDNNQNWTFNGKKIVGFEFAKIVAFELFDKKTHN